MIKYKMRSFHTNYFFQIEPLDLRVSITSWFSFVRSHSNRYRSKQQYISHHTLYRTNIQQKLLVQSNGIDERYIHRNTKETKEKKWNLQ